MPPTDDDGAAHRYAVVGCGGRGMGYVKLLAARAAPLQDLVRTHRAGCSAILVAETLRIGISHTAACIIITVIIIIVATLSRRFKCGPQEQQLDPVRPSPPHTPSPPAI